jgi:hypothetical protein
MPLVMKKFVKTLNKFPSNLPKYIYKNTSLHQRNWIKVGRNEIRIALKLRPRKLKIPVSFVSNIVFFIFVCVYFFICKIYRLLY